jgi:rubredoxin-NAD+ reductase
MQRVDRRGDVFVLTDAEGNKYEADLVLRAIGLAPETTLAAATGLKVNRGIVVDRLLQTSDPNIYALGDCAEVGGLVLPFILPIMQAARALAKTLAGTPTEVAYPAMPVLVKTPACPTVVSPPAAGAEGVWQEEAIEGGLQSLFHSPSGELLGFALMGEATKARQALAPKLPPML